MSEKQVEMESVAGSEILAITPKELYKTRRNYFLGGFGLATLAIASINAVQLASVYRPAHHHSGAAVAVYHYQPGAGGFGHHGGVEGFAKPRDDEFRGHPAESKGHPAESKGHPAESKGHPDESKGHPDESKGRPAESKEHPDESKGHHGKKHHGKKHHGKSRESQEAQAEAKHSEFMKIHYPGKQFKDLTESELSEIREYLRVHQLPHGAKEGAGHHKKPHHAGKKDVKAHRDFVTKFFNGRKFHELTQEEKDKVAEYLTSQEGQEASKVQDETSQEVQDETSQEIQDESPESKDVKIEVESPVDFLNRVWDELASGAGSSNEAEAKSTLI